jgi:hypothetical protein
LRVILSGPYLLKAFEYLVLHGLLIDLPDDLIQYFESLSLNLYLGILLQDHENSWEYGLFDSVVVDLLYNARDLGEGQKLQFWDTTLKRLVDQN